MTSFGYRILGFGSGGAGAQPVNADYLVIAGGGGGGYYNGGGGGGAGGMRFSYCNGCAATLEIAGGCTSITIGAGGAATEGSPGPSGTPPTPADPGCDSVLPGATTTITSAGGANGAPFGPSHPLGNVGANGGSGGGGKWSPGPNPSASRAGGSGNTPAAPTALGGPQGNDGGSGQPVPANFTSGGGGGRGASGSAGPGGNGLANGITGQVKIIVHKTRSNTTDLVITPANFAAGSTLTSNLDSRSVTLLFDGTNWQVVAGEITGTAEFVIA